MRRSWAAATVGALVLIVAAATYFLVRATDERTASGRGYTVWALFRDASGLYEKSRVQTAGISVGQIERRELDPKTNKAKIVIRLQPDIKLWSNAVVTKKSASLLGEYYLEIDPGTEYALVDGERREMRLLKDGDQIKDVREPTAIGDIMADVGTLVPVLRDILEDVRRLTSGTITNIAENVNKLVETNSVTLERLLSRLDHIAATIDGLASEEADDIRIAIENVRDITTTLKEVVGAGKGEVQATGQAVRGSLQKLQGTVDNLDRTMANLEKVTARLERGEGTAGRLLSDDAIANNIEDITENAGSFVRGITKLQTIVGLRTEFNFFSSEFKNYLSIQLMPRPDKFYLIEIVDDPRGYRETTSTYTRSSSRGIVHETVTTTSEKLRFSLMFGKRVGNLTGRFGIKESTGGAGLDLHLFRDRFTLSVDVFDTRANKFPRIQGRGALAVWNRNLWVIAGADDLANFDRSSAGGGGGIDWFLGTQLVFNDEDLKSLLLFGGGAAGAASSR